MLGIAGRPESAPYVSRVMLKSTMSWCDSVSLKGCETLDPVHAIDPSKHVSTMHQRRAPTYIRRHGRQNVPGEVAPEPDAGRRDEQQPVPPPGAGHAEPLGLGGLGVEFGRLWEADHAVGEGGGGLGPTADDTVVVMWSGGWSMWMVLSQVDPCINR